MTCDSQDLTIYQGKTFRKVIRWQVEPLIYKAISAITKAGPVSITATGHGVPDGWMVAIASAGGMRQINAKYNPPSGADFKQATVVDANTLQLNKVNSSGFATYTSGGYVVYYTPQSLAGYTARMTIRDFVGGMELLSLTTVNSRILLDDTYKTITLFISATDTAALDFSSGVYDLELVDGSGIVTQLLAGNIYVTNEVTT